MDVTLEAIAGALEELRGVQQNPVYHGEGDVLTHTHMVMEALQNMPSYQKMSGEDRQAMLLSAALHDLGKKTCTRQREGRWISPHHGGVGSGMVRHLLMTSCGLSGTPERIRQREWICAMVQAHMKPLYVFDADDPGRKVRRMAAVGELVEGFTLEKLAMLAEADNRGRICSDMQDRLDLIDRFRELAQKLDCYQKPFTYPDACSRYADLSGRQVKPGARVPCGTWGNVVMLSGLPGTGKDTFAASELNSLPMLSVDDLRRDMGLRVYEDPERVAHEARKCARSYLRARRPFVLNANNLTKQDRGRWISLFHEFGASAQIVYLETDWRERRRRNALRGAHVPEEDVEALLDTMAMPSLTETEEVSWLTV